MKTASIRIGFAILTAAALVSSGCGNNPTSDRAPSSAQTAAQGQASLSTAPSQAGEPPVRKKLTRSTKIVAPPDAAVITGWVVYQGSPPQPKIINFGPEKVCASLNSAKPPVYETLVVNQNDTVKWALVGLRGNVPGKYPPPDNPVVVDQVGCIFVPHVVGAMVGQEIEYRNSDPVSHNIRGSFTHNSPFNNIFSPNTNARSKFASPEIGVPLKCDIHFWMSGYVHVFSHPFFAITGDDGSFVISGVPPGDYTLLAWHETLKTQTQRIILSAGEVKEIDITFIGGD
jgi:plastocyanin